MADWPEDWGDEETALPPAATESEGAEVWDLRSTPAPEDVGIVGDETAVFETRPERPILLRQPDGVELRMSARYLAFRTTGGEAGLVAMSGSWQP